MVSKGGPSKVQDIRERMEWMGNWIHATKLRSAILGNSGDEWFGTDGVV